MPKPIFEPEPSTGVSVLATDRSVGALGRAEVLRRLQAFCEAEEVIEAGRSRHGHLRIDTDLFGLGEPAFIEVKTDKRFDHTGNLALELGNLDTARLTTQLTGIVAFAGQEQPTVVVHLLGTEGEFCAVYEPVAALYALTQIAWPSANLIRSRAWSRNDGDRTKKTWGVILMNPTTRNQGAVPVPVMFGPTHRLQHALARVEWHNPYEVEDLVTAYSAIAQTFAPLAPDAEAEEILSCLLTIKLGQKIVHRAD